MSEQGFCPTCGIPWPNFCPIDGKRLNGAWTCENAPKPVIRPAAQAKPAPTPEIAPSDDTIEMDPAARRAVPVAEAKPAPKPEPAPEAEQPQAPLRRAPDPDLMRSFVDNVGSRSERRGGGRRRQDPRAAATVIQPQLTEEQIAAAKERAAQRTEQAAAETAEASTEKAKKKKRDGFSDTQWFMKGLSLEVADPETGAVVVDENDYQVDESIPETERRKFTLRKKGEE